MLRFPGFEDSGGWGNPLIEDFFNVGSSKRVLQKDWTTHGVPFYRTRELVSLSKGEPFSSEIFISDEQFSSLSEKYGMPSKGDFLVSGVGTLGISYQVQQDDRFYFKDGNVLWLAKKNGINSTYFKYCFESDWIQNQIIGQTSKSTVGTYTIQNAKKTSFWSPPSLEEQQKIADCLSSLDELITAHTQKHQALLSYKKGLLQNLFPAEGETVPALRFPEFEDSVGWAIKPMKKLFRIGNGKDHKHLADGDIPVYGSGGYMRSVDDYLYDGESACIGRKGTIDRPIFLSGKFWTVDTLFYTHSFKNCSPKFIYLIFLNIDWRSQNEAGGVPSLSKSNIEKIEVAVPSLDEQQKIADCLSSLDELITAQSKKIEDLKAHKKGLMQQLFPAMDESDYQVQ